jgi:diacylglycerol kinase family enzyme
MAASPRDILVIVNFSAGPGDAGLSRRISDAFRAQGAEIRVAEMSSGDDARPLAAASAIGPGTFVVAAGGDGTVGLVAEIAMTHDSIFGVIPSGTLNHFARDLHIPFGLEDAIQVILRGETRRIDVGEVNGRIFVNNSGVGLYPNMVLHRERERRAGRNRWAAMFRAAFNVFRRYHHIRLKLTNGGERFIRRTPFLFFSNNDYEIEGRHFGRRPRMDAGHLTLYAAPEASRWRLLWLSTKAVFGHLHPAKDLEIHTVQEVTLGLRRRKVRVSMDGEVTKMRPPLTYRIRPGALRVLVPPSAPMEDSSGL